MKNYSVLEDRLCIPRGLCMNCSRDEVIEHIKKHAGEFPGRWFDEVLAYVVLYADELFQIVHMHRDPEIWNNENGK